MSYQPVDLVQVFAWGARVGVVAAGATRGSFEFQYDPTWVRGGRQLAPLLMPLRNRLCVSEPAVRDLWWSATNAGR